MKTYTYTYMFIYNIHHLYTVTANRIQGARALALVHLLHLCCVFLLLLLGYSTQRNKAPLLFANDVLGECAAILGQKHSGDTTHEIGNCGRNSPKMIQGAKTNWKQLDHTTTLIHIMQNAAATGSVKLESRYQTYELHNHLNYTG